MLYSLETRSLENVYIMANQYVSCYTSASSVWWHSGAAAVAAARLRVGLLGATWDLRQTAVNTLSYQLARVPKLRRAERRQKDRNRRLRMSTPQRGSPRAAAGANGRQGWLEAVRRASKQVSSTPNQPHRGFRPTEGSGQDVVGSHLVTTFFSLRLRAAQHFTYRLAAET
jgi:hypothetical protein